MGVEELIRIALDKAYDDKEIKQRGTVRNVTPQTKTKRNNGKNDKENNSRFPKNKQVEKTKPDSAEDEQPPKTKSTIYELYQRSLSEGQRLKSKEQTTNEKLTNEEVKTIREKAREAYAKQEKIADRNDER